MSVVLRRGAAVRGEVLRWLRMPIARRRLTRRHPWRKRLLAAASACVLTTGIAVAGLNQGYPAAQVPLRPGVAWLASNAVGQLTLLDGSSAEVAARVPVGRPGSSLTATQQGVTGYAINHSDGSIVRVDGTTFRTVSRAGVLPRAREELHAFTAPDSLYALDGRRGMLAVADPRTLAPRDQPLTLAAGLTPATSVVDSGGRMWALDPVGGDLVWFSDGKRRARARAGTPGRSLLTVVGGRPVLVDPRRRRADLLDPGSGTTIRSVALDLEAGETVAASGSPRGDRLYLVTGSRRELVVCSFGSGSCAAPVPLGEGPGLGQSPSQVQGRVAPVSLGSGRAVPVPVVPSPGGTASATPSAPVAPGVPSAPGVPNGVPGVPSAPGVPGGPSAPGDPGVPTAPGEFVPVNPGPVGPGSVGSSPVGLGAAVEAHGRVMVPDFSTGRVSIVDTEKRRVVAQPQVFDRPLEFELLVRDGVAFYNDPDSEQAGVIEPDGRVRRARKYDTANAGSGSGGGPPTGGVPGQIAPAPPQDGFPPGHISGPPTLVPGAGGGPDGGNGSNPRGGIVAIKAPRGLHGPVQKEFEFSVKANDGTGIRSARWTFGDHSAEQGVTVRHRWQRAGTFQVTVSARLTDGRRGVASVTVAVGIGDPSGPLKLEDIFLNPVNPTVGQQVFFSARTNGAPRSWAWKIQRVDDGKTVKKATTPTFHHKFTEHGEYRVTLTVARGKKKLEKSKGFEVLPAGQESELCNKVIRGRVMLHDDLDCTNAGPILGADKSVLDLAGHSIRGKGGGGSVGVRIGFPGRRVTGAAVMNGTIEGFADAVRIDWARSPHLNNLKLIGRATVGGEGVRMRGSVDVDVRNTEISNSDGALSTGESDGVKLEALHIRGGFVHIGGTNIELLNARVERSHILISDGAQDVSVVGGTIGGNNGLEGYAIQIMGATDVGLKRVKFKGAPIGTEIGPNASSIQILENIYEANHFGLRIQLAPFSSEYANTVIQGNTFIRNGAAGIEMTAEPDPPAASDGVLKVLDNRLMSNGDDGLHINVPEGQQAPIRVAGNTASGNKGSGIEAGPGDVIDGDGNTSTDDGEDCVGVKCT